MFQADYVLTNDLGDNPDPLDFVGNSQRIDARLSLAPQNSNWDIAVYVRDLTDERHILGPGSDFQSKSFNKTIHDAGGIARERGRRVGVSWSYYFGS